MTDYELKPLPYDTAALEPFIDEKTMEIHHDKHHKTYLDKLLAGLEKHPELKKKHPEELLKDLSSIPEDIRTIVRNHGGGFVNHNFFWTIMGPNAGGNPNGKVGDEIAKAFGDYAKFKEQFGNSALNLFGSGWSWLVVGENKELKIITTPNQDSPLMNGETPILGIDMWEHAFYVLRQNRKNEYVDAWWNVVNWEQINKYYEKAK